MPTWPTSLPQCPILNGYAEEAQPNVAYFRPDVGPPKVRRRSTAKNYIATMTFRMTLAPLDIFYDFYGDDLADGSLSFTWTHPLTGNDRDWLFAPDQVPKVRRVTPNTVTVDIQLITIT